MKTFLVPIDFSPVSRNAFQFAANLGAQNGARIILFHAYSPAVVEPYMAVYMQNALAEQQEEVAMKYFQEMEQELSSELLEKVSINYQLTMGPASEEILLASEELKPDMIIMGMRGGNLFSKRILGTTASSILQRAMFPVLVVPEHASYNGFKNIAYATNYEEEDTLIINRLLSFAKDNNALLHCWHIQQKGEASDQLKQKILKKAYEHDLSMHRMELESLEADNLVEGLNHYSEQQNINLLVMLTHSRSLIGQLFHHSNSKQMAKKTRIPLLVFQKQHIPASV